MVSNLKIDYKKLKIVREGLLQALLMILDELNNLKWKTLETRRFHTKATLMYKFLNDLSAAQLKNSFVKLNDTNINNNLRKIETDLALPSPCTNSLKVSFKVHLTRKISHSKNTLIQRAFQSRVKMAFFIL